MQGRYVSMIGVTKENKELIESVKAEFEKTMGFKVRNTQLVTYALVELAKSLQRSRDSKKELEIPHE